MVAPFGNTLHVSGTRRGRARSRRSKPCGATGTSTVHRGRPNLEDVFIHLMRDLDALGPSRHARPADMFSLERLIAVLVKEFIQMRRDRLTFAMMLGMPLMQLVLFGYAINLDPKGLPTAVVTADSSAFSRSLTRALENTRLLQGGRHAGHGGRGRPHARRWATCSSCCRCPRTSRAACSAAIAPSCWSRPTRRTPRRRATRSRRSSRWGSRASTTTSRARFPR